MKLTLLPLTPARWGDLEALFGARGCSIARSCWWMACRVRGDRKPLPPGLASGTSTLDGGSRP
jgi:hypothetical protein